MTFDPPLLQVGGGLRHQATRFPEKCPSGVLPTRSLSRIRTARAIDSGSGVVQSVESSEVFDETLPFPDPGLSQAVCKALETYFD